jgi:hypothetical protein
MQVNGMRAAGSSIISESLRLGGVAGTVLMPAARSKRCRQARPLTEGARLAERERPGCGNAHQCRTPVALGAQRSAPSVKGGSARAAGLLTGREFLSHVP